MTRLPTPHPARHPNPTVKAQALAYLMFERPDLELTERFLADFGLRVVARTNEALFLRGTAPTPFCYVALRGNKPRFVGFGLRLGSREDLEKLATLPGASEIEPVPWPGGGERIRLTDPSGFTVHAVSGAAEATGLPHRAPVQLNFADERPRINDTQRPPVSPPEVIRLGHVVLEVTDFQATADWYTRHFGFIPSDVQVLPDGSPAVAFMRLDLGDRPADHHTLALAQGVVPTYSHSAYEVVDADAVGMGQRVLRDKGWRHAWGIGRHILGSQIFDYWHDPYGDKHEHYTDGDLFTADVATGIHPTSRDAMAQWGQPMPRGFTQPRLTPATLIRTLRHLRRSPDLSVGKLITLARLFG
ncbi:VOC family protein [Archangium violaceum]|uniref:2,4,5-trihydroxytoluene oxygenase n=1 Tax=Archangium violaceum TaxID=83451 RepID=UPI00193BE5C1|nr:2,4,5-trihydroxytoluene oxygenase [Archangium violaceum]QRK06997.1 VOC family protein [Archangium violaceum]